MKYLPAEKNLRDFLAQHSLTEFSPFDYDREMVGRLLIFFQQAKESGELAENSVEQQQAVATETNEQSSKQAKTGWRRLFNRG